jgi:hypothetical protein
VDIAGKPISQRTLRELESCFLAFSARILAKVQSVDPADVPLHFVQLVDFSGDYPTSQVIVAPDIETLLRRIWPNMLTVPGARACARKHFEASVLMLSPPVDHYAPDVILNFEDFAGMMAVGLSRPVSHAIRTHGTLSPSKKHLRDSYRRYMQEWTAASYEMVYQIPLTNFSTDCDLPLALASNLVLAPFDAESKTAFWEMSGGGSPAGVHQGLNFLSLTSATCVFLARKQQNRGGDFISTEIVNTAGAFVTALRLHGPNPVAISALGWDTGSLDFSSSVTSQSEFGTQRPGPPYHLHSDDLQTVCDLFERVQALESRDNDPNLATALHHFNQSYERSRAEDRLIDLTVALEASLLANESEELKFRLTLRGVALLTHARSPFAESEQARAHLREFFRALYDARSLIVHEGASLHTVWASSRLRNSLLRSDPHLEVGTIADRAEEIVRQVLVAYLQKVGNHVTVKTANARLDEHVFRGLTPLPGGDHAIQ